MPRSAEPHGNGADGPVLRPGYRLDLHDDFDGDALDRGRWLPYSLPQWSSRQQAAARYGLADSVLTLRIDPDQPAWCPEFDGTVRSSVLQTGVGSGPVGSAIGQHRFNARVRVREAQKAERLYVPQYGLFEMRARMRVGPGHLAALWMIGFEDVPENSGEITIMEIFGSNVSAAGTRLGHGIKRINDPRLVQDFHEDLLAFDPADWHVYAAEWRPEGVAFFLDGAPLRTVPQSPAYPMQFMLNVTVLEGASADFLPRFEIDWFRASRPAAGYGA